MNRVFLRVLLGVGLALAAFALLGSALFHLLNTARYQQYREALANPFVEWLRPAPAQRSDWLNALFGAVLIEVEQVSEAGLEQLALERLEAGQTVVVDRGGRPAAFGQLSSDSIVSFDWSMPLEQYVVWTGRLIAAELQQLDQPQIPARLDQWRQLTGFQISSVQPEVQPRLPAVHQAELRERGFAVLRDTLGSPQEIWVKVDPNRMLVLSGLPVFDPWAGSVLAAISLVGLACLGVALYFLLDKLERRLRKVELVATRIARGEMNARVDESHFDAIGRLGQVFNRMADHIQRLVSVQREMIHAVSHELRTPVARIRFGIQMIEDSVDQPALHKQLAGIDSDIQELNELIDEILTYARLEQGGPILDIREVDLVKIVDQVVEEQQRVKPQMTLQKIFLADSEKWKLSQAEPRYIHRSLQNLVGNAMRYAKGRVVVRCNFNEETCRIDVEDDGPGIPEEDWEKVFTAFARLDDSRTRSSGGYGLGLSIVRRILYWHGGQAFVSRSELGGARFSLVWPRLQGQPVT